MCVAVMYQAAACKKCSDFQKQSTSVYVWSTPSCNTTCKILSHLFGIPPLPQARPEVHVIFGDFLVQSQILLDTCRQMLGVRMVTNGSVCLCNVKTCNVM